MVGRPRSQKRCKICNAEYMARSMGQKACSLDCALTFSRQNAARLEAKRLSSELSLRKEKLKTKSDYRKEAQVAFNRYIRLRDMHQPCISCGQSPYKGQRHASHYRTRKAAPQLAFNTLNVAASCAQCNSHKSGNITEYRIALVQKIGQERVEALEHNNDKADHSIEYLKRVKDIFSRRARLYERLAEERAG